MRCPRCTLTELSEAAATCWLCGYASAATVAVDEAPPPPPPPPAAPNELDARRELAREFGIEGLLQQPPGPIVYLARDAEERPLALKVVPRADVGPAEDRFHAAADAAAQLAHPHIVPVYRHGATENFLWWATKHVEGQSLATMLQTIGPLELSACLRIFEQVASALDYAHRRGVAHGALTPGTIIVDANEWALVDDFAMRGLLDTASDGAVGGPAPEAGEDQRALAAIAYECLTGTPMGDRLPAAEDGIPGLPLHVSQALRRAVSSRQADRFPSVLDFVAALGGTRPDARTAWFGAHPRKKGPGTPVVIVDADRDPAARPLGGRLAAAAAGLLVALGGGAAWLGISSRPASPASREPVARAPAPATAVPPMAPTASSETLRPLTSDPAPPSYRTPAPVRPTRPLVTTRAPVVKRPAPPPRAAPSVVDRRLVEPGLLSVNAIPWGSVYLDGQPIGNTPQIDRTVAPGQHRLRVERDGYRPYDRVIDVASGQRLRITDIALVER